MPWRLYNNVIVLGKAAMGFKRGEKLRGGYAIDGFMKLTRFSPAERLFINRLFGACFTYIPQEYPGDVVVYEANIKPLLELPQLGGRWRGFAPRSELVEISRTHLSMIHEPYVEEIASDMRKRIAKYLSEDPTTDALAG